MVANVLKESVSNLVVIVSTDIKANTVMWKSTNVKILPVQMVCCYFEFNVNIYTNIKSFFFRRYLH